MDELGIREGRAVFAGSVEGVRAVWIQAKEGEARVVVSIRHEDAALTSDQARRLASHLRILANRLDAKAEAA
jgi:uncharacterized Zn finger protein